MARPLHAAASPLLQPRAAIFDLLHPLWTSQGTYQMTHAYSTYLAFQPRGVHMTYAVYISVHMYLFPSQDHLIINF
jgi:hypothetical protein